MKGYSFRSLTDLVLKIFKTKVNAGTGLSGGGSLEADRTLTVKYGTTAGTAAQGNDSRLSNSREWTGATISQAEAEAGSATTRRAFTAQRVRQAIVAWFIGISGALGRTILSRTTAAQVRGDLGLGTAATYHVGEIGGRVMQVGAFGLGIGQLTNWTDAGADIKTGISTDLSASSGHTGLPSGFIQQRTTKFNFGNPSYPSTLLAQAGNKLAFHSGNGVGTPIYNEIYHTGNILKSTGGHNEYPISQKAVTDALNTKAALSHTHPWSQVTSKPAQATRWPTFTEVTGKPATYAPSSHTHPVSQIIGLGSAATRDVGTSSGQVMQVGAFGVGIPASYDPEMLSTGFYSAWQSADAPTSANGDIYLVYKIAGADTRFKSEIWANSRHSAGRLFFRTGTGVEGEMTPFREIHHTDNILQTTGTSANFPMSQKAVTDQLATRVTTSRSITAGTGLTGGGTLAANRTLSIAASHIPLGVGQSWRSVLASRSLNTTYTNTTGRPIQVSISVTNGANSSGDARFVVDGVTVATEYSTSHSWGMHVSTIIPAGSTYSLNSTIQSTTWVLGSWAELRG